MFKAAWCAENREIDPRLIFKAAWYAENRKIDTILICKAAWYAENRSIYPRMPRTGKLTLD